MPELPTVDQLVVPDPPDVTFEGFAPEAFALLERLRAEAHIDQYRKEKAGIRRYLTEPFHRFRDDLVVNFVLPNRLPFETEKNVFSRLLKNDFGAGGCHHHLWMAFYRAGRRRLTDVQLSYTIRPEGFEVSLFVGAYMKDLVRQARARIAAAPGAFLALLEPLLQTSKTFHFRYGTGHHAVRCDYQAPLHALPADLLRADALWLNHAFPRADVLRFRGALVRHALAAVRAFWPVYRFLVGADGAP